MKKGNDAEVASLIDDMNAGKIGALIVCGANPAYTLPNASAFENGLKKVPLTVSTALSMDETANMMTYVCPDRHNLESWGDAHVFHGTIGLMQPTIQPLFDSRQMQDSFLAWTEKSENYYALMQNFWSSKMSWSRAIHDGLFTYELTKPAVSSFKATVNNIAVNSSDLELALYQSCNGRWSAIK